MAKRCRPRIIVHYIENTFLASKMLGLFNFHYDEAQRKFTKSTFVSFYNRCVLLLTYTLLLGVFSLAYVFILCGHTAWNNSATTQDRIIWYLNFLHLFFGVLLTYSNHSRNQLLLPSMLNSILRANRRLVRLTGKDVPPAARYYSSFKMRLWVAAADICITINRPISFRLITYEWPPFVVVNKIILTASFAGWHLVQAVLSTSFDTINDLVLRSDGRLSTKDYRVLSRICTELYKVKQASNAYFGQFIFITCLSLIKTVAMYYSCFVALFLTGIGRFCLLTFIINFFIWMLGPGLVPVVDVLLLGIAGEHLTEAANRFHRSLLVTGCKRVAPEKTQRIIGVIMRQAHLEDLRTVMKSGFPVDRSDGFGRILEAVAWVIVFFMYNGGRESPAIITISTINFKERPVYAVVCVVVCILGAVFVGLYKAVDWACRRLKFE